MVLSFLPLVGALLLLAPVLAGTVSREADLAVTRVAVHAFGDYVVKDRPRASRQRDRLHAAHVGVTHRLYASKTLLYATVAGVSGSVLGVYVAAGALALLRIGGEAVRAALPAPLEFLADLTRIGELGVSELFPLLLVSSATVGIGSAVGVYLFRWQILDQRAYARATRIEATLPRTVAFVYALSRSGMALPAVLETLSHNEDVYGEAARELVDRPAEEIARVLWEDTAKALTLDPRLQPPMRVIKERRATFAQTPETLTQRPPTQSPIANLLLAGDWTDTGLPATIEGAVRSGQRAAELVLETRRRA